MSRSSRTRPAPRWPSPATLLSLVALFVALGGTSYAAITVTSKDVKDNSLASADVRDGSLTGKDVKDRSLTALDVRGGLPAGEPGARGPQGERGPQGDPGVQGPAGPKGDTGTVDTSAFYSKAESDKRFLRGTVVVVSTFAESVAAEEFATGYATCPKGHQAVGGGIDFDGVFSGKVSSSGPTFGGARLIATADGQHGPADGWFVAVTNQGATSTTGVAKVAVTCAPLG